MTTIDMTAGEELTINLPDGRTASLWYHTCETCTSLDVWTDRGLEVEEVSKHTGDTSRAPMGLFAWRCGSRTTIQGDDWETVEGAHGWPAVATVSLIWDDRKMPVDDGYDDRYDHPDAWRHQSSQVGFSVTK